MAVDVKQQLHDLIDRLSDEEARRLSVALRAVAGGAGTITQQPRPLTRADLVLDDPIMPPDESADDMIDAIRRWRREGGYA
jgi:hypothetical protein